MRRRLLDSVHVLHRPVEFAVDNGHRTNLGSNQVKTALLKEETLTTILQRFLSQGTQLINRFLFGAGLL